ncbi:hypothetical protein N9219_00745 [bacterium]|nr:hypothetical protein [bacterium]
MVHWPEELLWFGKNSSRERSEHMARHYSTKSFFRQMPNALLARYFQGRGLFVDVDFAA